MAAAPTHVPMDITTEILSRLPVKSLVRFKCVSKSFYNLISNDPLFRKKHLYHQSSFKKVILFPSVFLYFGGDRVYPCPLLSLSPEGYVHEDMIDLEHIPAREGDLTYQELSFHNSCDGLFCISMSEGDAVIWNPTTKQASRFQGCLLGHPIWIGYYLAHDSRSDIYKLLGLSIYDYNTYRLFFYSTDQEMGTWRYIEDSSCAHACDYVEYDGIPTIVNGAFHWLGSSEKLFHRPHVVVSLDISDETYGTLALPQAICCNHSRGPILYELKGKLCIFIEHASEGCCYLWVMNKYGDVDSMTRTIRISCHEYMYHWPHSLWPFHMLEDDTLLIHRVCPSPGQLYFYKDGRVLSSTTSYGYYCSVDPYVYSESLISPHTCLQGKAYNNHKIVPATTSRGEHSSNAVPENAFSSEIVPTTTSRGEHSSNTVIVANNSSPVTNQGKHVAKKGWQKSCLQRLCFCKSFRRE